MSRLPYLIKRNKKEEGQAVLILLLAIAVILTVGLSLVSRSITDVKISQQSQESARALWVAQAGLEKAIRSNSAVSGTLNGVNYVVQRNDLGLSAEYVYPSKVKANEPITVWFVGHDSDGNIDTSVSYNGTFRFYWGESGESASSSTTPALEVTLIYHDGSFKIKRYVYDPNSTRRSSQTNFSANGSCSDYEFGGQNFAFCSPTITPPSGTKYMVKARLLFNATAKPVGLRSSGNIPVQGSCFPVTATIEESGVTKRYEECQLYDSTPAIFDNLLYSGGGIE
ncbi:hypothetical protein C4578_01470 [Candidatus Microgenomates bacterium]|jgi:type II secretory pathway pseudopilin PulG|nr:MAG: hypothetical protein C4578_01470 [Candidatus Microgenomates bacterium]